MDFDDLKDQKPLIDKLKKFDKSVNDMEALLNAAQNDVQYSNLSLKDKLNFDLFTAYFLNTLFWLFLRSKGINPNETDLKKELERVKNYMSESKIAVEAYTRRMKVDTEAANRMIQHGIGFKRRDESNNPEIHSKKKHKKGV